MKKLYQIIIIIALAIGVLAVGGCDVQKSATKNKTDRILNEQTETITKRIGDTVRYIVPNVVYRDTTIVKKNYVTGTTQILKYDREGQLTAAECVSGFIDVIERNNKELIEAITAKQSEKTEKFDSDVILYALVGLALLIVIVGISFAIYMKSQMKVFLDLLINK